MKYITLSLLLLASMAGQGQTEKLSNCKNCITFRSHLHFLKDSSNTYGDDYEEDLTPLGNLTVFVEKLERRIWRLEHHADSLEKKVDSLEKERIRELSPWAPGFYVPDSLFLRNPINTYVGQDSSVHIRPTSSDDSLATPKPKRRNG